MLAQLSMLSLITPTVVLSSPTTRYLVKRDVLPNFPYDPATTKACTYWYDNLDSTTTCQSVASDNGITMEQLLRWNPYLKLNTAGVCTGWARPVSYCVEAYLEGVTTTAGSSTTTTVRSSTTSITPRPSAASWTDVGCFIDSDDRTLQNR